jgi:thioredoxin-dependent peroxiredoxin
MKRLILSIALSASLVTPALAALKSGDAAPGFSLQAALAGKQFTYALQDALKQGPVVVYFYPSAYTGGCNIQAHTFAINQDKFTAAGATIIGVSLDSIARLTDFSADPLYCAGKIPVASDVGGKTAKAYELKVSAGGPGMTDSRGAPIDHDFAERTTFIVTADGKIAAVIGGVSPPDNVQKALEVVQHLGPAKKPSA